MLKDYFRTHRLRFIIVVLAVVALIVAIWVAIAALSPMPPRTVTMATGPEGDAYYEVGKRYRELLALQGIELQLLPTAGSCGEPCAAARPSIERAGRFFAEWHDEQEGIVRTRVPRHGLL